VSEELFSVLLDDAAGDRQSCKADWSSFGRDAIVAWTEVVDYSELPNQTGIDLIKQWHSNGERRRESCVENLSPSES
jgi:hypothetical protein